MSRNVVRVPNINRSLTYSEQIVARERKGRVDLVTQWFLKAPPLLILMGA